MQRRKDNRGRVLKEGELQRKNGMYEYRWYGKDGKRHAVYSVKLDDLREKEEKIRNDLRDGIRTGERNIILNQIFEMWKNDKSGLKDSTRTNYIYMYEHFVKDSLGLYKIQEIKRSDVRRFYNNLIDTRNIRINTVENIHTVLHQVLKMAVEDEYIRNNPSDEILAECKRAHNFHTPKRHALTVPEQTAFVKYLRNTPKYNHWLPLFTVFLGTGCRVSEIVGLRWEDIDYENNYISINHNLVYYPTGEKRTSEFAITTPKTEAGIRIIPILPEVKSALEKERENQTEREINCNVSYDGYTDFVFLNRFGNTHNPQTINRTIKRITRDYNIRECELAEKENREPLFLPNFSCHNLRHTFCTRYCEKETNLKVIQEIMGHRDIATTMEIYAEATKDAKVESFNNLVGKMVIS